MIDCARNSLAMFSGLLFLSPQMGVVAGRLVTPVCGGDGRQREVVQAPDAVALRRGREALASKLYKVQSK